MGPVKAVFYGYSRMLNFTGRASRSEYWWFWLWQALLGAAMAVFAAQQVATGAQTGSAFAAFLENAAASEAYLNNLIAQNALPLTIIYIIAFVLPNLALIVRRLHDTDRRGWNILMPTAVGFASGIAGGILAAGSAATGSAGAAMLSMAVIMLPPLVASIWFLVWMLLPGTHGPNRFGDDSIPGRKPKEPSHPAFAKPVEGPERERIEAGRKAAMQDYYQRRVLASSLKAPE